MAELIFDENREELAIAAFHCQQAVEKTLKAYLVAQQSPFEKIHDLGILLEQCARFNEDFNTLRDSVEPLTIFAVAYRYPGPADPARDEVGDALAVVREVVAFVRARIRQI